MFPPLPPARPFIDADEQAGLRRDASGGLVAGRLRVVSEDVFEEPDRILDLCSPGGTSRRGT